MKQSFISPRALLLVAVFLFASCTRKAEEIKFDPGSVTGPFRWDQASGQTIGLHLNKHPFTESILPSLNEFTQLTGIQVDFNVLSEEEYRDKIIIELSSGSRSVDVFMTGPFSNWSYVPAGWLEPLDDYLQNPSLTNADYDIEDFFPTLLKANRWNGKPGYQNYGTGSQWSIPVQVETYILAYRKDWAQELDLDPPGTYQEFHDFARAMTRKIDGQQVYGITSRGLGTWPTIATGFISAFASFGCRDFDASLKSMINTPCAVEMTSLWVRTIKEYGPMNWSSNSWYDAKEQFESGRYGMIFDADFFASSYENPEKSLVAGRIGYSLPPAGPDGTIRSNLWTWALAINQHSRHKLASWLFIQWATSREQLIAATLNGNLNPPRRSVWNDQRIQDMVDRWGNYRQVVQDNLQEYAQVCWTPQPEITAVGDRWARALQEMSSGVEAQKALNRAAEDIDRIIARAGIKPDN